MQFSGVGIGTDTEKDALNGEWNNTEGAPPWRTKP